MSKKETPHSNNTSEKIKGKPKYDVENFMIAKAIKEGESGELIDTDLFLKSIAL